jgi:hypothetical protein
VAEVIRRFLNKINALKELAEFVIVISTIVLRFMQAGQEASEGLT